DLANDLASRHDPDFQRHSRIFAALVARQSLRLPFQKPSADRNDRHGMAAGARRMERPGNLATPHRRRSPLAHRRPAAQSVLPANRRKSVRRGDGDYIHRARRVLVLAWSRPSVVRPARADVAWAPAQSVARLPTGCPNRFARYGDHAPPQPMAPSVRWADQEHGDSGGNVGAIPANWIVASHSPVVGCDGAWL